MRLLFSLSAFLMLSFSATSQTGNELYRPEFHYSPEKNWLNDPNGLVYYAGEYHLFYQYNPFGIGWGHMSWGHAKSKDLMHWEHLPVAIPEENGVMAFSGSVVVDHQNTSGFGVAGNPPLVAVYTGAGAYQDQRLAFSLDSGLTWTNYANNPVINIYSSNFRDPKVIWHEASQKWIMVVSMGEYYKIRFYSSPNLKDWTILQDFGPLGNLSGVWECPDLFPLQVDDDPAKTKWVLVHSIGPGMEQYFIGDFDGSRFSWEKSEVTGTLIADFEGPDYQGWTLQGNAFGDKPVSGNLPGQQAVSGYLGNQLVNSFKNGDGSVGRLISPAFTIQKKFISFLIGGGNHPSGTYIKLVTGNKVVASATGSNDEFLDWKSWDVGAYQGEEAHIIIVDSVTGGWGHINIDHLIQSDTPVQTANFGKVDFGKDFYASQSFFGMPGNRHIWLAWMSNWTYAGDVPTYPWRGIMTLPREVKLKTIDGEVKLVQSAIPETETIKKEIYSVQQKTAPEIAAALRDVRLKTFRITAKTAPLHSGSFALKVRKSMNQETLIIFDVDRGEIRFDRSGSGALTGNQIYSDIQVAPLKNRDGKMEFDLFVDNCSVELFSDQGQVVVSNLIFPDSTSTALELVAADTVTFEYFEVREMKRSDQVTAIPMINGVNKEPLRIFPNPAREGKVTILSGDSRDLESEITIFRLTGEKVMAFKTNDGKFEIPVINFPGGGIYLVVSKTGSHVTSEKIVLLK